MILKIVFGLGNMNGFLNVKNMIIPIPYIVAHQITIFFISESIFIVHVV